MCNVQTKNAINFHTVKLLNVYCNLLAQIREIMYVYNNYIYTLVLGIFNFYIKFSGKSQTFNL